jgi:protocatechuate 3,4-dioxygenase beta subunit
MDELDQLVTRGLSRRAALRLMGSAAAAAAVTVGVGCSGSKSSTSTTTTTGTTDYSTCSIVPEGEEGPYFVDDSATGFNRSNILSNLDGSDTQSGIPLTLNIYVYDTENNCAAMPGVQIDIWHCNALGVYSAEDVESTVGETWLRGYQLSDSLGLVTFATIVPGWYQGRTTHIHLRVRSSFDSTDTGGTNTTQLFFPQATIDTINTTVAPYSSHGTNSTTNASDQVYTPQTEGETELTLTGDTTSGYSATFKIGLPITGA